MAIPQMKLYFRNKLEMTQIVYIACIRKSQYPIFLRLFLKMRGIDKQLRYTTVDFCLSFIFREVENFHKTSDIV